MLASPSGGGKNTIINRLLKKFPELEYSVSVTTRKPGRGERSEEHYHFVSREEFERMIEQDELVEYAEVHNNYYGTPRRKIEEAIAQGKSVVMDLDVQGALKIKSLFPSAVLIFILPPSMEVLKERLVKRRRESAQKIEARLKAAEWEIEQAHLFDHQVVNDDLESAVEQVAKIISEGGEIQSN